MKSTYKQPNKYEKKPYKFTITRLVCDSHCCYQPWHGNYFRAINHNTVSMRHKFGAINHDTETIFVFSTIVKDRQRKLHKLLLVSFLQHLTDPSSTLACYCEVLSHVFQLNQLQSSARVLMHCNTLIFIFSCHAILISLYHFSRTQLKKLP